MRGRGVLAILLAAVALGATPARAQSSFTVPFPFESAGKKLAAGSYVVSATGGREVTFRHASTGKEVVVPFSERLTGTDTESPRPRLVFDEVGTFEPSYTEYFTVYMLAEVWLSGREGFLVHATKGAHKNKVVNADAAK